MAALVAIRRKQQENDRQSVTASFITSREIAHFLTRDEEDEKELQEAAWIMREQINDKKCWGRKEARELYEHPWSQMAVAGIIVLNFVAEALGAQLQPDDGTRQDKAFIIMEMFFTIFFAIELLWNMYGTWFYLFWVGTNWGWNIFDFIVVVISFLALIFPNLPGITVLRLFRAFRVARLFKRIPSLRKIIEGVLKAIPGLLQMGTVLLIFLGIWSVIGVQFYSEIAHREFGTFAWAMYTMAKAMLGEFVLTSDKLMYTYNRPEAAIFFYSFIFIVGIVMMNVVVAILLENYLDYQENGPDDGEVQRYVFEDGYPTLYIRKEGILHPIRSIGHDQIEDVMEFLNDLPAHDRDVSNYSQYNEDPVEDWTTDDVVDWLETVGFSDFEKKFLEGDINGKRLISMSMLDMLKLGMQYGRQIEFNGALHKLVAHHSKRVKKLAAMRAAFDNYDEDNSGYLDKEEFRKAWKSTYNKQGGMVTTLARTISRNANNKTDQEEEAEKEEIELEEDLDIIFKQLDIKGDGKISWEEFRKGSDLFGLETERRRMRMSSGYFAGATNPGFYMEGDSYMAGSLKTPLGEARTNSMLNQQMTQMVTFGTPAHSSVDDSGSNEEKVIE